MNSLLITHLFVSLKLHIFFVNISLFGCYEKETSNIHEMYRKRLDFYDSCCYFKKLKITQLLTLTHYYYNMKGTSSYQHWQPNDSQHNFGDLNSYDFYFLFLLLFFFYISCVVKLNQIKG